MPKKIDLAGQRFGRLTAREPAGTTIHGKALWRCDCECGNTATIIASKMKSGHTQSCGCLHKEQLSQRVRADLAGKRFGALVALEAVGTNNSQSVIWRCACDCGNETETLASYLNAGDTKSCGCRHAEAGIKRSANIKGERFGRLVAIKRTAKRKDNRVVWSCVCDCGDHHEATAKDLRSGHVTSCGCLRGLKNQAQLVGQRFGRLVVRDVIYRKDRDGKSQIICDCDCGGEASVVISNLVYGGTQSCGCLARERAGERLRAMAGEGHPRYKHGLSRSPHYVRAASSKRRARKRSAGGMYGPRHIEMIYRHQESRCNGCGDELPLSSLTHDHIVPLSKGGANDATNIQLLCMSCNSSKHTREFMRWAKQKHGWSEHRYMNWLLDRHQLNKRLREIRC